MRKILNKSCSQVFDDVEKNHWNCIIVNPQSSFWIVDFDIIGDVGVLIVPYFGVMNTKPL